MKMSNTSNHDHLTPLQKRISQIDNILVVLSGKGGVGKSTVASQLAFSLSKPPYSLRVGILDIDICGPSIPSILGVSGEEVYQSSEGWVPIRVPLPQASNTQENHDNNTNHHDQYHNHNHHSQQTQQDDTQNRTTILEKESSFLGCMSIGFLLKNRDDAVVWRGPKKHSIIRQFMEDVYWTHLDVLIIDTPPGTSDEHITLAEMLKEISDTNKTQTILVTTPQNVSITDVRKEVNFCQKLNIPMAGIVENMSGYACPCCHEITYVFGEGGGKKLAQEHSIPFLGSIPLDPQLGNAEDEGKDFLLNYPDSTSSQVFKDVIRKLSSQVNPKWIQHEQAS